MSAIHNSLCNMLQSCLPCHKAVSSIFCVTACQTVMTRDPFKINKQLLEIKTRQGVYIQCNIEARLCNHCCSKKSRKFYIFQVCVCSHSYLVCKAHMQYCHLWPVWFYNIFTHYLIKTQFSEKSYET